MAILDDDYTYISPEDQSGLHPTPRVNATWISTGKWAVFLSVLGFIIVGFIALLSVAAGTVIKTFTSLLSAQYPLLEVIKPLLDYLALLMLPILTVFFFIYYYHIRFASGIQKALRYNDQALFAASWRNLRNYFRIYGIVMIIFVVLYLVVMILALGMEGVAQPVSPLD